MKNLRFDNRILKRLPIDPETQNFVREVKNACFSRVAPTPVKAPSLVAISPSALSLLGLPTAILNQVGEPSSTVVNAPKASEKNPAHAGEDINADLVAEMSEDIKRFLSGNELMEGSEPASHCYCGHQFGSFAGQLGDGAAIYLGEVVGNGPLDTQRWELQLKGAGMTPYSRSADGRKVLRSSLREFIGSEYMHAVGIPTTRAGSLITSDSRVARDPIYSGEVVMERCTVISRIAETFVRFGSFEICKEKDASSSRAGPSAGNTEVIRALFTYVAEEFFPNIAEESKQSVAAAAAADAKVKKAAAISQAVAAATGSALPPLSTGGSLSSQLQTWQEVASTRIFAEICKRTASLVAKWQALGWVHGVLNTDNMSIIGLTIDYGPFGFMTHFDNDHVSNLSDNGGRYAYKQQPAVCQWNLGKLAEAWALLFPAKKPIFDAIVEEHYGGSYNELYKKAMAAKLGIDYDGLVRKALGEDGEHSEAALERASKVEDAVVEIIGELIFALQTTGAEMTNTFNMLKRATIVPTPPSRGTDQSAPSDALLEDSDAKLASMIAELCIKPNARQKIVKRRMSELKPRMPPQQIEQLLQIARADPEQLKNVFTGNMQTEELIHFLKEEQKKVQDYQRLHGEFIERMGQSVEEKQAKDAAKWKSFITEYRKTITQLNISEDDRRSLMAKVNPVFVPFPWVLQDAIVQAEEGQYSLIRNLVDRCNKPFAEDPRDGVLWKTVPPADAEDICVSCSS